MWRNRITRFLPSDRAGLISQASRVGTNCCASAAPAVPPGAFVVPASAGPQPGIYDLAREQASFELRRRKRMSFTGLN